MSLVGKEITIDPKKENSKCEIYLKYCMQHAQLKNCDYMDYYTCYQERHECISKVLKHCLNYKPSPES